jgi:3-phenylpropionate/cinnamic acid dioxygenase small subunit
MLNESTPALSPRFAAEDLLATYCAALDEGRLEDWCDLFTGDASYRIDSRENADQGLPASILLLETRAAMADRVTALRKTAVYNIHHARRFTSGVRASRDEGGRIRFTANVGVYQTDQDGHTRLFVVGEFRGVMSGEGAAARLHGMAVVLDTFTVPTLLAFPV